ncbi:telomerase holoenzyme est3 subunit [Neofusicoccum parvum]|nr:telomerase holoenzyme est3 subunit [Neofusicoccum parvum]
MGSILKPWLGEEVEEEVDMALEYWETDPKQRTRIEHSQAQEAMFEDDGSNLRIQVQMALSARAHVQIVNVRVAVPVRIV